MERNLDVSLPFGIGFCNAGFDILGTTEQTFPSLTGYIANPLINIVIMLLIVIGGIGFLTWDDFCTNKWNLKRYRLQSKIILVTTAVLILLSGYFFLSECISPDFLWEKNTGFFFSVGNSSNSRI